MAGVKFKDMTKLLEKEKYYKFQMVWKRLNHGLFLFSLRNFMTRFGLDFDPYYWEQEGLQQSSEPAIRGGDENYIVAEISPEETSILNNIMGMDGEQIRKAVEGGQLCIGLKHEGVIAALMFAELNDFVYKNRSFLLKPGEAYLLNMYTFEAYRGKNLAPYLRYHSYKVLEKKGYPTIYSITAYFNKSSLKFKQKLNVRHLKLFMYIGIFKRIHWNVKLKTFK